MKPLFSRLPQYFKNHQHSALFERVAKMIDNSTIMTSFILCQHHGNPHLMHKDGNIYAPLDWQLFSLMRASAKLSVSTGNVLRAEKGLFMQRESYGDSDVDELFRVVTVDDRQKLMLLCKEMTPEQLAKFVNESLYEIVESPVVTSKARFMHELTQKYGAPIILELGLTFLHPYYEQVINGGKNSLDSILITMFQGQMQPKYIGNEFKIPLKKLYKHTWKSQSYPCKLSNGVDGQLRFETYIL